MAQTDTNFVKFVKSQKYQAKDTVDVHKKHNQPFNAFTKPQPQQEKDSMSICDLLKTFSGKIIPCKANPMPQEDNESNEDSLSQESDYEVEKVNHFLKAGGQNEDDESEECLRELKKFSPEMSLNTRMMNKRANNFANEQSVPDMKKPHHIEKKRIIKIKEKHPTPTPKLKLETNPSHAVQQNTNHTGFLGNLPLSIDESRLKNELKTFGKISGIRLMKSKDGKSKGFAYIDFASEATLDKAVKSSGKIQIEGKEIKIEKARSSYNKELNEVSSKRLGKKKQRSEMNKKKQQYKLK